MGKSEIATFAGGCFWCTEAIFRRLKGVLKVTSGYSGGRVDNPGYEDVSSGLTGHAEAIQIQFDPEIISYPKLLEVFFKTHDPTTINRQGADVGSQYRSVIFYHNEEQKRISGEIIQKIESEKIYDNPIVTEITPINKFYEAEEHHKNYYENNKSAAYCQLVINPKIKKLEKLFGDLTN